MRKRGTDRQAEIKREREREERKSVSVCACTCRSRGLVMPYRPFQAEAQGHAHTLYQVAYMRTGMSHIHVCARGIDACEQRPSREAVSACARACAASTLELPTDAQPFSGCDTMTTQFFWLLCAKTQQAPMPGTCLRLGGLGVGFRV